MNKACNSSYQNVSAVLNEAQLGKKIFQNEKGEYTCNVTKREADINELAAQFISYATKDRGLISEVSDKKLAEDSQKLEKLLKHRTEQYAKKRNGLGRIASTMNFIIKNIFGKHRPNISQTNYYLAKVMELKIDLEKSKDLVDSSKDNLEIKKSVNEIPAGLQQSESKPKVQDDNTPFSDTKPAPETPKKKIENIPNTQNADFLAQIRTGTTLKKATADLQQDTNNAVPPPPPAPPGPFQQISKKKIEDRSNIQDANTNTLQNIRDSRLKNIRTAIADDDDDDIEITFSENEQKTEKPTDDYRQTSIKNRQIQAPTSQILDKPENTNSRSVPNDLLSEIRKGKDLKKVTNRKIEQANSNVSKQTSLADTINKKAENFSETADTKSPVDDDEWK